MEPTLQRDALLRALDLAGGVLGEGAPRWQRLEAVSQEYLGAYGADEADDEVVAGALADGLGGLVDPPEREWTAGGLRACDGHDPEGNVLQLREPAG